LTLNYPSLQNGLSTVLVNCESQEEIFADKVVALCLRKHIKARDLWDLVMLEQQQLAVNDDWVMAKFKDYGCEDQPLASLNQRKQAMADYWQSGQFEAEMRRFLPTGKVTETLGKPEFMPYFMDTVDVLIDKTIRRWEGDIFAGITPQFRL
jgi:predicted nucleotidyltransferase component of viral defense system